MNTWFSEKHEFSSSFHEPHRKRLFLSRCGHMRIRSEPAEFVSNASQQSRFVEFEMFEKFDYCFARFNSY